MKRERVLSFFVASVCCFCAAVLTASNPVSAAPVDASEVLGQWSMYSTNYPNYFITWQDDTSVWMYPDSGSEAQRQRATFQIVTGLFGTGTVSFEAVYRPGFYLFAANDLSLYLVDPGSSAGDLQAVSYTPMTAINGNPNAYTFESLLFPTFNIRHCSFRIILNDSSSRQGCSDFPQTVVDDQSWFLHEALQPGPPPSPVGVPEPSALAMFGFGLFSMTCLLIRHRRRLRCVSE